MLKYENTAEVGDTIKAYDFKPMSDRPDRYVAGKVIGKGTTAAPYRAFTIIVDDDSGDMTPGPDNRVGCEVFVPFETAFAEFEGRVAKIEGPRDETDPRQLQADHPGHADHSGGPVV